MAKPSRPSEPSRAKGISRTFFITTCTAQGRAIFQTDRMASLLIDVLRSYMQARKFLVHDFVIMPDHLHLLLTVPAETGLEKAVQLIKGGFSHRAAKEIGFGAEIWQRGFSDVRIIDDESFRSHQAHIEKNPVNAGLANAPDEYRFGSANLKKLKLKKLKLTNSHQGTDS